MFQQVLLGAARATGLLWSALLVGALAATSVWVIAGLSTSVAMSEQAPLKQELLEFLEAVDKVQPVDTATIQKLIGKAMECSQGRFQTPTCEARDVVVGQSKMSRVERRGSLLIFEGLSGSCLSIAAVEKKFGRGQLQQACTDGVICTYLVIKRPWGILSLRQPEYNPTCATAVVMASD